MEKPIFEATAVEEAEINIRSLITGVLTHIPLPWTLLPGERLIFEITRGGELTAHRLIQSVHY